MCGIAGMLTPGRVAERVVGAMADTLVHRGPDDRGTWIDVEAGIGFGHRRLSIIDRSPAGHQPFRSRCGRYMLCYNGEIYNHLDLRRALEASGAIEWRGHSDTETLVEAIAAWGLAEALRRATGMFAIGVWDCRERTLSLARDRVGEKPLYYGWAAGAFLFASELKALRAVPGFDNPVDRDVLALYLRNNYVPTPWSIHRHVYKLEPGTILTIDRRGAASPPDGPPQPAASTPSLSCQHYWSMDDVVVAGRQDPIDDPAEAVTTLEAKLQEAVALQTVADVPVGAFLSGGIDSSLIVALMRRVAGDHVRTFTIGFGEAGNDEAPYAKAVARHLGTDHTEFYVTPEEAMAIIPGLPAMYDEPFADSSQIPTHILSKLARGSVTVALSGDGGDELFGGYNRYTMTQTLWNRVSRLPAPVRRLAGMLITALPQQAWDRSGAIPFVPKVPMLGNKAHKFGRVMQSSGSLKTIYDTFVEEWHGGTPLSGVDRLLTRLSGDDRACRTVEEQMMYWDTLSYLPDDLLCKVDRAAMATSLEVRVPFLDHHVVTHAWRMPLDIKMRHGQGKWVLQQILARHVPKALTDRPKAGFGVPVGVWLRGPLRGWAEELLSDRALSDEPAFDRATIRRRWQQHLRGTHDWTAALWSILMYQSWSQESRGGC